MRQTAVSFEAEGLSIEGVIAQPDGIAGPFPAVVICHPHPLFGGNMDNSVVLNIAFALAERGMAVIRFNFRGVGNSQGEHAKGELEHQETLAAIDLMKAWPGVDGRKIGLADYSFGSSVVMGSEKLHKKSKALALISPPLRALESTPLRKGKRSAFFISGDRDKLVGSAELTAALDTFSKRPECHIVPGADHFWGGHEGELASRVGAYFLEALK